MPRKAHEPQASASVPCIWAGPPESLRRLIPCLSEGGAVRRVFLSSKVVPDPSERAFGLIKNANARPLSPGAQFPVFGGLVSDEYSHDTIG